jgi:hypothetical protein
MHRKNTIVDHSSDWKVVKQIDKLLPKTSVVAATTLIPEAVYFRDVLTLVVAAQQVHLVRVLDFVGKEDAD